MSNVIATWYLIFFFPWWIVFIHLAAKEGQDFWTATFLGMMMAMIAASFSLGVSLLVNVLFNAEIWIGACIGAGIAAYIVYVQFFKNR